SFAGNLHSLLTDGRAEMRRSDIEVMREVVTKVTQILAGMGVQVTQRGMQAYVETDKKTLKPIRVNLPYLPDNADQELIMAMQGFLDHEVAHILFTDWSTVIAAYADGQTVGVLHNIFEDPRIEAAMHRRFTGSAYNLEQVQCFLLNRMIRPKIEPALRDPSKTEFQKFSMLAVCIARAWAGQQVFIDYMSDKWGLIPDVVKRLKGIEARAAALTSSQDALDLAREVKKRLGAITPPSMPMPPMSGKGEKDGEKKSAPSDAGEPDQEDTGGDHDDVGDEENKSDEGSKSDEDEGETRSSKSKKDDDEGDDDEGDDAEGDDDSDAAGDSAGSDSDEGDDADTDADSSEGAGEDDAGEDSQDGDHSGTSGELDDQDDASSDEGDEDGLSEDDASSDEGEPSEGGDSGDKSDAPTAENDDDGDDADQTDESGEEGRQLDEEASDLPAEDAARLKEIEKALEDFEDFDDMAASAIRDACEYAAEGADYLIYTNEFDRIEPAPKPSKSMTAIVERMDSDTRHMIGPMQKEIERLMAAHNRIVWQPGLKRGKLNPSALHRLSAGDPRVFRKRQDHKALDTAVELVVDLSGSMRGRRVHTAMVSAYALSQTLERINIAHEVIGFTTGTEGYYETMAEGSKTGVEYSRYESLYMPIFKDFTEKLTFQNKEKMAHAAYGGADMANNIDGECVQIAGQRLSRRTEERKIMIVLSDGEPAFVGDTLAGRRHLKKVVTDLESAGVETLGIGIQSDSVEHYYSKHVVISSVEELPTVVLGFLKSALT
ncbi:hypothetical protein AY600_02030, partial [Phormidium willei BDU 130791]